MGREIRMVPENWEHPKQDGGSYKALYEDYKCAAEEFLNMAIKESLQEAVDYMGCPDSGDYMPDWHESQKTHLMMYETCTEGTPISPAFKTPEELARWLSDNKSSSFGLMTATYDQWLNLCNSGWAPSAVLSNDVLKSGVEALLNID